MAGRGWRPHVAQQSKGEVTLVQLTKSVRRSSTTDAVTPASSASSSSEVGSPPSSSFCFSVSLE